MCILLELQVEANIPNRKNCEHFTPVLQQCTIHVYIHAKILMADNVVINVVTY